MTMLRRETAPRPDPRTGSLAPRPVAGASSAPARPQPTGPARPKADELFQVMRQLSDLLVKENAALKRHRADEIKHLTERKEQLARLYQGHMNAVHREPQILKALDQAKRAIMAQAAMRLGELMQENASLLKANISSINMFFKAVTEALRHRHEEKAAAYSRRGALNGYAVTKRSLAVSFNQTM
jgi:hypothetical protein